MKTLIPFFEGFYASNLDSIIDNELENICEYECEKLGREITTDDLIVTSYGRIEIAKKWLQLYKDAVFNEHGIHLDSLQFNGLQSPKYYNFSTDKLLVSITKKDLLLLKKLAFQDKETLQKRINSMFKSCDGFISFYGDFVQGWKNKPFSEWDENEVSVLFPVLAIDYSELCETASNALEYNLDEVGNDV